MPLNHPRPVETEPRESYMTEVISGLSRFLNALVGGDGSVTVSASAWESRDKWWGKALVAVLDRLNRDPDHCRTAWEWHYWRGLI